MKNFVQPGNSIRWIVDDTGGVKSGDGVMLGSFFGIAAADGKPGDAVELQLVGVFKLPKDGGAIDAGAKVSWSGGVASGGGGTVIGAATEAADAAASTVNVRLNGVAI